MVTSRSCAVAPREGGNTVALRQHIKRSLGGGSISNLPLKQLEIRRKSGLREGQD